MEIDLNGKGLGVFLKDYQEVAMNVVWRGGNKSSRDVWVAVNQELKGKTISRASIINFLNDMVDQGFLDYSEITGKGGHRRIYKAKLNRDETWLQVIRLTKEALMRGSGWDITFTALKE